MESPQEPHFFQPLLPGFHSAVEITLVFFSKHVEGKTTNTTWILRSDASDQTWEVRQHGRRLIGGWENFAKAHRLRIGDIVIFKKEGPNAFHVTPIGPSFCAIQYTFPAQTTADPKAAPSPTYSWDFFFQADITLKNLKEDKLHLPVAATSWAALKCECQEAILVNTDGDSWRTRLVFDASLGTYYITGGWTRFCRDNGSDIGNLVVFNVIGDGKTPPLFCVCPPSDECLKILGDYRSRKTGKLQIRG